jgi:hypothetical protein
MCNVLNFINFKIIFTAPILGSPHAPYGCTRTHFGFTPCTIWVHPHPFWVHHMGAPAPILGEPYGCTRTHFWCTSCTIWVHPYPFWVHHMGAPAPILGASYGCTRTHFGCIPCTILRVHPHTLLHPRYPMPYARQDRLYEFYNTLFLYMFVIDI